MLTKLFLGVFAVVVLAMGILTYVSLSWLDRIGFAPAIIANTFEYWSGWHLTILWTTSFLLLVISNIVLWKNKTSWALWLSFGYFAVFLVINTWWLSESLFDYKKANNLWEGGFQLTGLFGAFMVVVVGIGTFFDQFLISRIREKLSVNSDVPLKTEIPE